MSTRRRQPGGWIERRSLAHGTNGKALCRRCGVEVEPPRRTFCSDVCVHEWRLSTDPGYLREQVFRRDRGVCALCGCETMKLGAALRRLNWRGRKRRSAELGIPIARLRAPWDADHILPVAEGGGECDLANLRTLCIPCHRRATEELRERMRRRRRVMQEFGVVLS